jgi:hypothetical protein
MRNRMLIMAVCILLSSTAAFAHGGEEHVIGVVAKLTADSITVKTPASKMVTVAVTSESKFIKNKGAGKFADLSVGARVVIHAKEPTKDHLVADTVEFASAQAAQSAIPTAQSKQQTFTGVISDSACGATHTMKNMSAADCARMCVKSGQKYVLVVGKSIYTLQGHDADLEKLAGANATINGNLNGKTLTIKTVASAPKG